MRANLQTLLDRIRLEGIRTFRENLTGIYLHGSLAFGCFQEKSSDIDFIVVTKKEPALSQKMSWMRAILAIEADGPPKGLEMSVVLEEDCRHFSHPARYQLHYSQAHLQNYLQDPKVFCETMHGTDRDLAAHFTIIREKGIALFGPRAELLFGPVPPADYLDSIRADVKNAAEDILQDPTYVILNLCRVAAYVREGAVLSKQQGGEWGLFHLPKVYAPIINQALDCYSGGYIYDKSGNDADLIAFAQDLLKQMNSIN